MTPVASLVATFLSTESDVLRIFNNLEHWNIPYGVRQTICPIDILPYGLLKLTVRKGYLYPTDMDAIPPLAQLPTMQSPPTQAPLDPAPHASPRDAHSLQPASPGNVPPHTFSLTPHRYDHDHIFPRLGQLINIRLATPVAGPGSFSRPSSHPSSSASSHTTSRNYHSAVVIAVRPDAPGRALIVTVFPIPSYSNASAQGFDSPTTWVSLQPHSDRIKHIPMPSKNTPATPSSTPIEFGTPVKPYFIDTNGQQQPYFERRQSWIFMEEHTVRLPFTNIWKTFSPDIHFPIDDIQRLQQYHTTMQVSLLNNNNSILNRVQLPDFHYPVDTDPWVSPRYHDSHWGGYGGVFHDLGYDEDESADEDEVVQYDGEPEYSPLEFFRMIRTNDPVIRKLLEEEDAVIKAEKNELIMDWIASANEDHAN